MKHLAFFIILISFFQACQKEPIAGAKGEFNPNINLQVQNSSAFDLGEVKSGEIIAGRFYFKAEGSGALVIKKVEPDCGCTAAQWTKDAVMAGDSGFVEIEFDSHGYNGVVNKKVTIYTNAINQKAEVIFYVYVK
jgi:hypothetical protein